MKNKKVRIKVTIGVILVLIGIFLLSYNYLLTKKEQVFETMYYEISSLPLYVEGDEEQEVIMDEQTLEIDTNNKDKEEIVEIDNNDVKPNEKEEVEDKEQEDKNNYVGRLIIPKINFNRGFYAYGTKENNVDTNIAIMKGSSYPDKTGGNFILAGHSGNVWFSYFKNLYKLKKENLAYVYYKDVKYTYKIVDIYTVKKNGTVTIKRNSNKTTMTLITCTKDEKDLQTIYILEQVQKEY